MNNTEALMRYFYRVSATGHPVPGSLIARMVPPPRFNEGTWVEVQPNQCCTTTTTTSSTTTTTTSA